jgi:hypothetical protein
VIGHVERTTEPKLKTMLTLLLPHVESILALAEEPKCI